MYKKVMSDFKIYIMVVHGRGGRWSKADLKAAVMECGKF
jgi:hypothetical protein